MSLLIAATALEQRVAETASGRGFDKAIDDFARLLGAVPDSGPRVMGGDELAAVRAIAETSSTTSSAGSTPARIAGRSRWRWRRPSTVFSRSSRTSISGTGIGPAQSRSFATSCRR